MREGLTVIPFFSMVNDLFESEWKKVHQQESTIHFFYYFLIKTSEQKKLVSLPYYSKEKEKKERILAIRMKWKQKNSCDSNRLWKSITNKKMRKKMFFHLKKAKTKSKNSKSKKFLFIKLEFAQPKKTEHWKSNKEFFSF